jgi:hypothetical protein
VPRRKAPGCRVFSVCSQKQRQKGKKPKATDITMQGPFLLSRDVLIPKTFLSPVSAP